MLDHFDPTDPIFTFAVALATVLLVPMLFRRIRLPEIVGLILAGVFLGPHATNLIHGDSFVQPFGSVGLLYLMFLAGLEVDMHRFQREKRNSAVFGTITFAVPMIIGTVGALFFLGKSWAASILLASMFASHTLLPYPIVQKLGLVKERVVTTAVGGTVLTDTLALLVLAVVAESTRGDLSTVFWVRMAVLLTIYVALAFWSIPRVGRWFFRKVPSETVPGFLFVLVFAYAFAAAAPLAGLEPIIGAFLAGLALNMLIPENSRLMIRLNFVGESFFIPFFLISVGLMVDINLLMGSGGVWVVLLFMVITAYVTKYLAAISAGRILGFTKDERGLLYGLSVNQAAATLAAVVVGVRLGVFGEDILNGTVLMILATCTIGPWLTEKYGRRVALTLSTRSLESSGAPERIMIPVSSHGQIMPLVSLALMLRDKSSGQPIYPAMITTSTEDGEEAVAAAEKMLADAVVQAVEADTPVQAVTRLASGTVEGLMGAAMDLRISTIVLDENYGMEGDMEHLPSLIADQGRHLVVRFMNPAMVNTCKRLLAVLPPLIERQPGFMTAWIVLERLLQQAGTQPVIVAHEDTLKALRRKAQWSERLARAELVEFNDWHRVQAVLFDCCQKGDLPVFFAARSGRLAWQPSQERIPGQLSRKLGDIPLLVVHPPEMKWEARQAGETPAADFRAVFPPENAFLALPEGSVEQTVGGVIREVFTEKGEASALLKECAAQLESAPLWLSPDCLLIHTHKAPPPAPMAILAVSKGGFTVPDQRRRAKMLVLLLGTPEESAEEHLGRLATIASLFHGKGVMEAIIGSGSYDGLLDELNRTGNARD
jgi:Kef-type K+ transport system membrane component KefB